MLYTFSTKWSQTTYKLHLTVPNINRYCTRYFAPLSPCPGCNRASWACSITSSCHSLAPAASATAQSAISPSEVTILIKECADYESLQAVVQDHEPHFNTIHAAAAFTHAAQLSQQLLQDQLAAHQQLHQDNSNAVLLEQQQQQHWQALCKTLPVLLAAVQQQCSNFQGRQVANCAWAVVKLLGVLMQQQQQQRHQQQFEQSSETLLCLQQQLVQLLQGLLEQTQYCWHLFTAQELVLLLYAVASMPCVAAAAVAVGSANASISRNDIDAETENNDGTASSKGLIGAISGASASAAATATASIPPSSPVLPSPAAAAAVSPAADGSPAISVPWANRALQQLQKLHHSSRLRLKPQEFEMLLISLRKLQQQSQQQPQVHLPMALLKQLLAAAAERSYKCRCRDIAGILYSVTALYIRPSSSVTAKLLAPLSPGSRCLRSCKPVDVTNILYALAALDYRPWRYQQQQQQQLSSESAIKGLVTLLLQQRQQFPAAELAVSLYALGKLRVRLPAAAAEALAAAAVTGLRPDQQQELVLVCWGLAASGFRPRPVLLQAVLVKYLRGMADAAQTSRTAAAGVEPTASQLLQQTRATQHVAMLLWSLGRFQYCPPQRLLRPLLQLSHLLLQHAAPEHLACICWGLSRNGIRPSKAWLSEFSEQLLWLMQPQSPETLTTTAGTGTAGSGDSAGEGFSDRQVQATQGSFNGQTLAMVLWGLVRMLGPEDGQASSTAVSATTAGAGLTSRQPAEIVSELLESVVQASHSIMTRSPLSVGVILWGFVKLGVHPDHVVLQTGLQALLNMQQQQRRGGQQRQQLSVQQQRRYAQSLSLTVWSLGKLGAADEQKQLLMQVLWANVTQVKFMNPTDLTATIWGLNKLQLRPPTPWLLNFYTCSQSRFEQCTDLRLASLVVPLHELLQRQPGDSQPQQQFGLVPPAVWQLQLELEVQSRWKRRKRKSSKRRSGGHAVAAEVLSETGGQQQQQAHGLETRSRRRVYDPLRIVTEILNRWGAVSVGSSPTAVAQQLPVQLAERPALV